MISNYIVLDGDTFDNIALKFNISPDIIKKLNGDISIKSGDTILIPNTSSIFDYYTVKNGDTLYKIAKDNNIDSFLLAQLNGVNIDDYIYPNQVLLIPKASSILYITANGDTLYEVANGLNVSIMDLLDQNKNIYLQPEQLIVYKYE